MLHIKRVCYVVLLSDFLLAFVLLLQHDSLVSEIDYNVCFIFLSYSLVYALCDVMNLCLAFFFFFPL
jgi:hypothetical protein